MHHRSSFLQGSWSAGRRNKSQCCISCSTSACSLSCARSESCSLDRLGLKGPSPQIRQSQGQREAYQRSHCCKRYYRIALRSVYSSRDGDTANRNGTPSYACGCRLDTARSCSWHLFFHTNSCNRDTRLYPDASYSNFSTGLLLACAVLPS